MAWRALHFADVTHGLRELPSVLALALAWRTSSPDAHTRERRTLGGRLLARERAVDGGRVRECWWWNGAKRRETSFANGAKHGRAISWYASGKRRFVGEFRAGRMSGEWFFFRRDGVLDGPRTGLYDDGLRYAAMKGFNDWNA